MSFFRPAIITVMMNMFATATIVPKSDSNKITNKNCILSGVSYSNQT